MKSKRIALLGIVPLLLTGCAKNKHAIVIVNNADLLVGSNPIFIDTDENRIIGLMESEISFILYEYSTACSHCEESTKNFENYLKKYQYCIYRYNAYMSPDYHLLNEYNEEVFPVNFITPRVLIVNHGKAVDDVASSKLTNSTLFNSAINAFTKENNYLYSVNTLEGFKKLGNDFDMLVYNSLTKHNVDKYNEIYSDKDYKKKTVLIDEAFASKELIDYISD